MTSHSQAAVLVTFEQVGDDVVATWTGTLDPGSWAEDDAGGNFSVARDASFGGVNGAVEIYDGGSFVDLGLSGTIDSFTGTVLIGGSAFYFGGVADATDPGISVIDFSSFNITQTFADDTLAAIGASSFDNTVAWTSSAGDTISFTTVPEPSSTALMGLGALALMVRRRR